MMWGTKVIYPSVHPSIHDPFLDEMSWSFQHFLGPGGLVLAWYWHCRLVMHWDSGDAKRGRSPLPAVPGSRTGRECIGGSTKSDWLVVSNMLFIFHSIWDVILPIDELIFFKMVKSTNQEIICRHQNSTNSRGFMKVLCAMVKAWDMGFGSLIITT